MMPNTALVRRGLDGELDRRLPKGLVGRVWREFARPYRRKLVALIATIVIASALVVAPPYFIGRIVDALSQVRDGVVPAGVGRTVTLSAVGLIVLALVTVLFSIAQRYYSAWLGEQLIADMRQRAFRHVQRMPVAFFTRTQTGALISRLNNDVVGAQRALTGTFGTLTANTVQVAVALAYMFALEWRLTLLVLSVLPVFVMAAKYAGRRLQALTRESMQLNADMNTLMTERFNVAGATLVKLFGRYDREGERFGDSAVRVADVGVRSAVVGRLFFATMSLVGALGTAAVYLVGGQFVLSGTMSTGDVVAFAALVITAYSPLAALSNAPVDVLTALISFDRVFEILDLPHPITDAPDAVDLEHPRGDLTFDRVRFAYPSAADSSLASLESGWSEALDTTPGPVVLDDVSFSAAGGQTVALVGPSGAGKTTMTALVPRLYDVSGGAVRVDGHDVRDLTVESLRAAVGVVSQDPHLFHDTVRANLRYAAPDASDAQLEAACRAAQIHEVISALPEGYDTVVGERGYRLSGGEKQRLSIARVLLKDPAIIVLDEATAHLDSESEAAVQAALRTALAGRTSLVIAHRLSTIVGADLILVVSHGRVVQQGTHAELVRAEGLYADLYHTQFAAAEA
ncbi:MAG: ABC transporter ATP-binding protein/permease [Actinobacteria bacterium]|nr:ABC transporter ATP-binding protein/permease [Actinomycetota bacterium]